MGFVGPCGPKIKMHRSMFLVGTAGLIFSFFFHLKILQWVDQEMDRPGIEISVTMSGPPALILPTIACC